MKAQIRLGFFVFRSREPAFRCNLFCFTFCQTEVLEVQAKKDFHCNQGYALCPQIQRSS